MSPSRAFTDTLSTTVRGAASHRWASADEHGDHVADDGLTPSQSGLPGFLSLFSGLLFALAALGLVGDAAFLTLRIEGQIEEGLRRPGRQAVA